MPFCPHCSAPQIRVVMAEPALAAAPAVQAAPLPASQTVPVLAVPMEWSRAVAPCALAALIATLLVSLGLHPLVGMPSGGFLAVVFYRARIGPVGIKASVGAGLGALSGLFCFSVPTLLRALAAMIPDARTKIRAQFIENLQKAAASRPSDPQLHALVQRLTTPAGLVLLIALAGVVCVVLGGLGGALAGAIFGRRYRQ